MQQPIKHMFNVLCVMDFACTALVISITQNSVSHPSLRCYTLFKKYKKLNCCEKLGIFSVSPTPLILKCQ